MKTNVLLSLFLLSSLDAVASTAPSKVPPLPKEIQKLVHQPLISSYMTRAFTNIYVQSHASGHQVYDHKVILKDKKGHEIRFTDELDPKESYEFDKVAVKDAMINDVWFFSPNGSALPDSVDNPQNYCTYEKPCSNVTQDLIDKMHQAGINGNLWFATGDYQMPSNPRQHNSKVLFLYSGFEVRGRTSDFLYYPETEERPTIEGTLAWNVLNGHYGGTGFVGYIKSHVSDNVLYLMDYPQTVNLYSTGWIILKSVDVTQEQNDIAGNEEGSNVYADRTYISNSFLFNKRFAARNVTAQTALVYSSSLTAEGRNAYNVTADYSVYSTYDDYYGIGIYDSAIKLNNACWGQMLATSQVAFVDIAYSTLEASAENTGYTDCQLRAIDSVAAKIKRTYEIFNSKIVVNNSNGSAIGIVGHEQDYQIYNSQIAVNAQNGSSVLMYSKSVTFMGEPSTLSSKSGIGLAKLLDVESIANESSSPSQCQLNDDAAQNC